MPETIYFELGFLGGIAYSQEVWLSGYSPAWECPELTREQAAALDKELEWLNDDGQLHGANFWANTETEEKNNEPDN